MLNFGDTVVATLQSHHVGRTFAVSNYQGVKRTLSMKQSGLLSFQGDGAVQATASITAFGSGDSLVPHSKDAALSPYGQEVSLFREVISRDGTVIATIPLGVYRIIWSGDARERFRAGVVLDWEISIDLADRFRMFERAASLTRKSPRPGNTMWDEIRRLSLIPVQVSLPDRSVPSKTAYNDRASAIRDLADLAGGTPHLTRQGALTMREKDRWLTETTPDFDISGTIEWSDGQSDEFYNYVRAASPDDKFVAFAVEDDDSSPLSVNRAGPSTYEHTSPQYTSFATAQAGANTILARLLSRRSRLVTVKCTPDALLLELGDFGWVRDANQGRAVLGEVSALRVSFDPTDPVEVDLIVAEEG